MTILVCGIRDDEPLGSVLNVLEHKGAEVLFLNQERMLSIEIEIQISSNNTADGKIRIDNEEFNLKSITAAYIRQQDTRLLSNFINVVPSTKEWLYVTSIEESLLCWLELTSALVINRPSAMGSDNSKPYQSAIIQSFGFKTPKSIITTDKELVIKFWKAQGAVIYKSISGTRSIVSHFTEEHLSRLENITWCPTQFQQYIEGKDYRVHVVGDKVFVCKIESDADDYRYATRMGKNVSIVSCELPKEVENKCKILSQALGLTVTGIDLRLTSDGKWYCFEVNPSPAFTFFQAATNHRIDEAIADLLIAGKA